MRPPANAGGSSEDATSGGDFGRCRVAGRVQAQAVAARPLGFEAARSRRDETGEFAGKRRDENVVVGLTPRECGGCG